MFFLGGRERILCLVDALEREVRRRRDVPRPSARQSPVEPARPKADGQLEIDKEKKYQQEKGQWNDPDSFLKMEYSV